MKISIFFLLFLYSCSGKIKISNTYSVTFMSDRDNGSFFFHANPEHINFGCQRCRIIPNITSEFKIQYEENPLFNNGWDKISCYNSIKVKITKTKFENIVREIFEKIKDKKSQKIGTKLNNNVLRIHFKNNIENYIISESSFLDLLKKYVLESKLIDIEIISSDILIINNPNYKPYKFFEDTERPEND